MLDKVEDHYAIAERANATQCVPYPLYTWTYIAYAHILLVGKNAQPKLEQVLAEVKALNDGGTEAQSLVRS